MFGSGVPIGMTPIVVLRKQILRALRVGLTVWTAAAAGASMRGSVALRTVTSAALSAGTTA